MASQTDNIGNNNAKANYDMMDNVYLKDLVLPLLDKVASHVK